MMKKTVLFFLLLFMGFSGNGFSQSTPNWIPFNQGMEKVKKDQKPMMVFVYATWCGACRKMERETLTDKKIIQFLEKFFISSKLNADEQDLEVQYDGKKYLAGEFLSALQIRGIPAMVFVDKTGKVIGVLPGVFPPDLFYNILTYIKDACYLKKVSLDTFMENPKKCDSPSK